MQGVVKSYDPGTGTGVVVSDRDLAEYELAGDALEGSLFRMLRQGQRVVFDLDGDGRATALGSGGSNRLRTAILQVLLNMIDLGMAAEPAVTAPRIHYERGLLNIEGGFDDALVYTLTAAYPNHQLWPRHNLFFGGTHVATCSGGGAGDPRRGGVAVAV